MKVYAIFDDGVESFSTPYFAPADGAALRSFMALCCDKRSDTYLYPSEFTLYRIGDYDPVTALLTALDAPLLISRGSQSWQKSDATSSVPQASA